jgi:hypothetical protein
MKSKSASEWSGNVYSRDSGNSYYGTISMKGPNSLKVEACALGRFFCSGNVWSRAYIKPVSLMSDRGDWPGSRSSNTSDPPVQFVIAGPEPVHPFRATDSRRLSPRIPSRRGDVR